MRNEREEKTFGDARPKLGWSFLKLVTKDRTSSWQLDSFMDARTLVGLTFVTNFISCMSSVQWWILRTRVNRELDSCSKFVLKK